MQAKDRDRNSRTLDRGDFVPRGSANPGNDGPWFYPTLIDDNNQTRADHDVGEYLISR